MIGAWHTRPYNTPGLQEYLEVTLQLAMVGCGGMGLRHAHGYIELRKEFDSLRLTAVCDRYEEAASHVASVVGDATGDRPVVYTDLDEMLDREPGLDALDIVTDPSTHHVFALKAFDAGLNVMTEKPMGLTIRACQVMRSSAERAGKVLSIAENYRRDPMNRLAKALIEAGAIGKPNFMLKAGIAGGSALAHNTAWRAMKSRAGGPILDQGVHEADLLMFFMGDIQSIYAETAIFAPIRQRVGIGGNLSPFYAHRVEGDFAGETSVETDQEDSAFAVLRFASGAVGHYAISNASHGHAVGMNSVHGTLGTILLPPTRTGRGPEIRLESGDEHIAGDHLLELVPDWQLDDMTAAFWNGRRRMASYDDESPEIDRKLIAIEYQDLAQAIETGNPPEVDAVTGMKTMAVQYGVLESGLPGQPVQISDVLEGTANQYQRELNEAAGL